MLHVMQYDISFFLYIFFIYFTSLVLFYLADQNRGTLIIMLSRMG